MKSVYCITYSYIKPIEISKATNLINDWFAYCQIANGVFSCFVMSNMKIVRTASIGSFYFTNGSGALDCGCSQLQIWYVILQCLISYVPTLQLYLNIPNFKDFKQIEIVILADNKSSF